MFIDNHMKENTMRKKFNLILLVLVALGIFITPGCKKNNDIISNFFIGSWTWVSTRGGYGGLLYEANNENSGSLILQEDGKYEMTATGAFDFTETGFYNVSVGTSLLFKKEVTLIKFDHVGFKMIVELNDTGQLVLTDDVFDGFIHIYNKNN